MALLFSSGQPWASNSRLPNETAPCKTVTFFQSPEGAEHAQDLLGILTVGNQDDALPDTPRDLCHVDDVWPVLADDLQAGILVPADLRPDNLTGGKRPLDVCGGL